MVRVRIAPSPTGFLHVGTARTALFNFLFARSKGGVFIVRIEDTDLERSDQKFELDILENLQWLGLTWDEGPILGSKSYRGDYGPYRQSERLDIYASFLQKLLDEDRAYRCFHSEEALEDIRKDQEARSVPQLYPGYCRDSETRTKLQKAGSPGIIRFKVPSGKTIAFDDLIRGRIEFNSDLTGDFSIAKDLRVPLYNFAVVIDDYTMRISHIIRGEDHISNTPKQILLAEALGIPSPKFGHLPLILGTDRSKLSKRHGATSVKEYRDQGYTPETLINFMALLGWSAQSETGGTNQEVFSMDDLVKLFSLEKVQKSGAVFNLAKLDFLNVAHMRRLPIEELTRRAIPFFVKAEVLAELGNLQFVIKKTEEVASLEWIAKTIALERERVKKLSDFPDATAFFFTDTLNYSKDLLRWRTMKTDDEARDALKKVASALSEIPEENWTQDAIAAAVKAIAQGDNGRYFWPLRVALSGREKSPGPQEIAEVLGKTKTLQRIEEAKNLLG